MKLLPDNPNLDHLRQQAKDLLAGLRDVNPATTLAGAQAALAEQYGFHTWMNLKAEVDRRQGGADIAEPSLASAVADRFGLGRVTAEMRSLAQANYMGRPWSLETERGRWFAQTVDDWMPIVDVEAEVNLQEMAAKSGIQLPMPVRSTTSLIVEEIDGRSWRVNEWRHSGPPLAAPVSATTTRQVGEILATLHGFRLPVDRISPWHAQRFANVTWPELATKARTAGAVWASELEAMVPALVALDGIGAGAPTPDPVLSHNVLGPGMVRKGADGRLVVFAWEHAGGQPPSWELAQALADWAVDPNGGVNTTGAQALLQGYASVSGEVPTFDLAMFRGTAISVANYTFGQVSDALADLQDTDASRSAQHLLTHLSTRQTMEELLDAVELVR